ncbi:MAG: T9SS type A sorting domain-containing protein [Marinilabiliaceae bacterium]|nr:T9SS type A sorting domain-containing protein [Marinilabiliaceae bacterium]
MKNLIVLSWIVGCSLILAEHSHAQGFGKLPTEAYRNDGSEKIVYTYDNYGHVTSETLYFRQEVGEEVWYELMDTRTYEYHQMPSGYFVLSKEQDTHWRRVSTYDNKGMLLYEADESFNFEDGVWSVYWGQRAVVNSSGIRTGLERINANSGQFTWELDPGYTFDHKGRLVEYYEEWEESDDYPNDKFGKNRSKSKKENRHSNVLFKPLKELKNSQESIGQINTYRSNYVWNDSDALIGFSIQMERDGVVEFGYEFKNITVVLNGEYYNPYDLYPSDTGIPTIYRSGDAPYAWEDHRTLQLLYNADIEIVGFGELSIIATVSPDGKERIETLYQNGIALENRIFTIGNNGSWTELETGGGFMFDYRDCLREYNVHGAMIREYDYSEYPSSTYLSEDLYDREYNSAGYPTKTSYTYRWEYENEDGLEGDEWGWEETYTAWIDVSITDNGIVSNLVVYPNPTSGQFSVFSFQLSDVGAYNIRHIEILDIAGRTVYREPCTVNREPCTENRATVEIDISHLPAGIYFVKVGNEMAKLVKK